MASRTKSSGAVLGNSNTFQRSTSPTGRFCSSSMSSSAFASSFSSRSGSFFTRSSSPTRVNIYSQPRSSSSVRFSFEQRPTSPGRSISVSQRNQVVKKQNNNGGGSLPRQKKTCMCSPTTHPGSFRCSLHKNVNNSGQNTASFPSNRLNARRSAMTNSLVRICGVEGDLVKRALSALIRPSSHHQKRRAAFQPGPSRLSVMSKAEDLCV